MADIKYTPSELLAQSTEMTSLQNELQALFQQTTSALTGMNDSWSENLARNFSGKIQSAQSSFSSILNMLGNGAAAAKLGATSHSATSIESFLESVVVDADTSVAAQTATSILTDQDKQDLYDMLPEDVQKAIDGVQNVDSWLAETYDSLPDNVKNIIDQNVPSSVKSIISVGHDIISGEADASTVGNAVTAITGDPLAGAVTEECLNLSNDKYINRLADKADELLTEYIPNCISSGDYAGAAKGAVATWLTGFTGVEYATIEGTTNVVGKMLESTNIPVISQIGSAIHDWNMFE